MALGCGRSLHSGLEVHLGSDTSYGLGIALSGFLLYVVFVFFFQRRNGQDNKVTSVDPQQLVLEVALGLAFLLAYCTGL